MKRQNVRTLSLIVVTFTYLLFGAAIFDALESEFEVTEDVRLRESAESLRSKYNITIDDFERITQLGIQMKPYKAGTQWKFAGAFYFSTTVITTIGYGHSTPKTVGGKVFCMCYALPGIPLCLIMFQSIGERMNTIITYILQKFNVLCKIKKVISQTHLMIVSFTIGSTVLTIGAVVFSRYEDWDYLDSFYYCFVTLTTIGFGDFVALQRNNSLAKRPDYVAFSLIFILFGLTVVSSVMNLLVLRFLTMNTEDEKRDQLEAAVHAQELQRLRGDVISADKQMEWQQHSSPPTTQLMLKQLQQINDGSCNLQSYRQNNMNNLVNYNQIMSVSNSHGSMQIESFKTTAKAENYTINNAVELYHDCSNQDNAKIFNFCLRCLKKIQSSSPGVLTSPSATDNSNLNHKLEGSLILSPVTCNNISSNRHDKSKDVCDSCYHNNKQFPLSYYVEHPHQRLTHHQPFVVYDEVTRRIPTSMHEENSANELPNSPNSLNSESYCENHFIYPDCRDHSSHAHPSLTSKMSPLTMHRYSFDRNCTREPLHGNQLYTPLQRYATNQEEDSEDGFEVNNQSVHKTCLHDDIENHTHLYSLLNQECIVCSNNSVSDYYLRNHELSSSDHFSLPNKHSKRKKFFSDPMHPSFSSDGLKPLNHNLIPRQSSETHLLSLLSTQPPPVSSITKLSPSLNHYADPFNPDQSFVNSLPNHQNPSELMNSQSKLSTLNMSPVLYLSYKRFPRIHQEQQREVFEKKNCEKEDKEQRLLDESTKQTSRQFHTDVLLTNDVINFEDDLKSSVNPLVFETFQYMPTKRRVSI
ncbi:unnamed protein product [Heterobilharzia americana]|nr:unnamed protein product [Heterobilharzia americana]